MTSPLIQLVTAALIATPAITSAAIVNVSASVTGCDFNHCSGGHPGPGVVVDSILNPAQITLGPGSYTITNGSGKVGANPDYTAWNFNDAGANWLWAFVAIDDGSRTVLLDSLPDAGITVVATQAAAAAEAAAKNYVGHVTLIKQRTIDFVTEDYYPYDNLGGVALEITRDTPAVPEPATWALFLAGFVAIGYRLRGRRGMPGVDA